LLDNSSVVNSIELNGRAMVHRRTPPDLWSKTAPIRDVLRHSRPSGSSTTPLAKSIGFTLVHLAKKGYPPAIPSVNLGLPRHDIDLGPIITRERVIAPFQKIDVDVVQRSAVNRTLLPCHAAWRMAASRSMMPALCRRRLI
jgi:hypothetical protein